jgi:hypothetical protein
MEKKLSISTLIMNIKPYFSLRWLHHKIWHSPWMAGFTLKWVLVALLLNLLFFNLLNLFFLSRIQSLYNNITIDFRKDVITSQTESTTVNWEKTETYQWLAQNIDMFSPNQPMPAAKFIEAMFATIKSNSSEGRQRGQTLCNSITGQVKGWKSFWLSSRHIPAVKIFEEVARQEETWSKIFYTDKYAEDKQAVMIHCIEFLQSQVHGEIRSMLRFNGDIQWLTMLCFWILLIHLMSRIFHLYRLEQQLRIVDLSANKFYEVNFKSQNSLFTKDDIEKLWQSIEIKVYYAYQFLLGTIPSLGFIGTVVGMGEALLQADLLFSAKNPQERQVAVNRITQHLGFAFDTTFVALVASIVIGVLFVVCYRYESTLVMNLEQKTTTE